MSFLPEPLATRQYGLFTRAQALEHLTPGQLHRRIHAGVVVRVEQGVYRFVGASGSWRQRALAAVLAAGPPVALSMLPAAYLWGVEVVARPPALSLTVPATRRPRVTGVAVVRSPLAPRDVTSRFGIPVTAPARTVVDLSRRLDAELLGRVADDLLRRRLLDLRELEARLDAGSGPLGRHRAEVMRRLVDDRRADPTRGASPAEDWLWDAIVRAGLPLPERHVTVCVHGRWMEIDAAYPAQRIAIEYDSVEFHRDLRRFHSDRERAALLALDGWLMLQITSAWDPTTVVARVGEALAQRAGGWPAGWAGVAG